MSTTTKPTHAYLADHDLPADHQGDVPCTCGRPRKNKRHDVPGVDPAVLAAERRRTGDH